MILTRPQREAIARKYRQNPDGAMSYLEFRRRVVAGFSGCESLAVLNWCGMWLGVEPDGYTHS